MILFYIFASLLLFKTHRAQEFYPLGSKFEINDIDMFEIYRPNVYIVDLRKEENLNKKLIFTCSSGPKALDLNLTFTGTDSKFITIPLNQKYVLGKRSVNLELNLPLVGEYTGRYNCTALYENNEVETISWYVYFYPGKEDLFLKCPLYGKIPKCLVFYRYKVPFKIPCRALHPAISVAEHTTNLHKFEYDPEQGFYGTLSQDVREFECRAFFDNKMDFQKYDLERKAYNTKIVIEAPSTMDFVPLPTSPNLFGMVAKKHQSLNLTCVATVGCNDINYDIHFKTNTTDKYKVVLNVPDRAQCLVNYNAMSKFSKSIIIDRLTRNESYFQCEINYGTDLKTPSAQYMVFFPDNPFLTPRPESPLIADYTGVTDKSSFLRLDAFFDASGPITIEWFLNKEKLNTKNYQASETAANKFETDCVHAGIFSYNCFLYIDFYNAKDVGVYEALIRLKEDPETTLRLNISVIMPKSPDTILLLPKYCTQNWTCELNRTTALQCNAQAHRVARMKIFKVDCIDVDDCYRKKTNQTYLQEFLIELLEEEEMTASDPNSPEENKQHLVAATKKSNLIGEEISTPSYALGDIEKYEYDKDELTQAQLTPVNYDTLETLDSGLTWSIKSAFRIRKVHLIICIANNEIGDAIVSRIILPSGLNKGRLAEVRPVNERDKDREIVEGDSLSLEFNFNNIYYDVKKYKLNTNPLRPECKKLSETNVAANYTYKVVLKFDEVAANCNYNYTMELTQNKNPYFTSADSPLSASARTVLTYNLDVLSPVKPFFLFPHSNDQNHTILVSNGTNGTNATTDMVVIAGGDTLVVESDKTIELRCENDGRPKPIVTWFKDGKMLNLTEHKFRLVNNSSLKIFRTHQVDSGLYECSVYNRYGQISRHFNVTVNQNTIFIKGMGKRHIFLIAIISFLSLISLALLVLVTVYLIKQKRENTQLKKKHEKLVDFLNGGNDLPDDIAEELMINSKLENLEKLKFDNLKWEIEETRFLIHDKVLGEGNFGRVCLATVSSGDQLRDESEVNNQWPNDSTLGLPNAVGSKLKSRFSFKRGANTYSPTRSNEDSSKMEDIKEPLLNKKGSRLAAAKMVKDQKVNASDIDALLQELKILAYIGFNLNIIQLFGCYTKDLVARGFACVFVEYCANGDLKHWLRANANKYSKVAFDLKNSMIGELKKRLSSSLAARPNSSRPLSDPQSPTPDSPLGATDSISRFNDTDLTFFAYQIAKGMEYLARKRFLHKDLAARNILLTERFECKISDFGLADESKLTSATFFGRVNSHIPLKWSAPEAILQKRFEANSDIWSFGIVLWEIFTLCENDPYSSYPNKEFMEYMSRENGNVNPGLPENGSNEMHEIMNDCWEVDTKTRPTFEQVVPRIEKLLSNQHKQYYEMLNERFKKVCNEITKDRIFRRDANSRDSGATRNTAITSPTTPSPYTANSYVNSSQQSNTNSAGYLQPTPKSKQAPKTPAASSSYLEPVSKPIANTQSNDGYLMPQQQKPKTDTYGGDFDEDEVRPLSDTYLAPSSKAPRPVSQSSRFRPPPTVSYINEEAAQFIDQDEQEHQSSGYLAPRQGSQMSTDSNTTTSSTAPLKKRFAPLAPIKTTDTSTRSSNNNSSGYIAPEMPKLNKLSLPRTHKETDV